MLNKVDGIANKTSTTFVNHIPDFIKFLSEDNLLSKLNLNTGIGMNAIFGGKSQMRISLEIGPRVVLSPGISGVLIFPHIQFMFGFVTNKNKA